MQPYSGKFFRGSLVYLWLKLIHIAAVVAFLGNITTGLFWHAHAARSRDPRLLAFTMDGIIRSDRYFTLPGVAVILLAGIAAAMAGHYPILGTPWIAWTIALFVVSGLAFMLRVAPLQRQLLAMAKTGAESGRFEWDVYARLARRWEIWGALALVTPLAGLVLMVLKPTF